LDEGESRGKRTQSVTNFKQTVVGIQQDEEKKKESKLKH